jgi:protein TonB
VPRYFAPDEVDSLPRLLTPIEPAYPPGMRARAREGDVKARVMVRADGSVAGAELLDATHPEFSAALREVIRAARFAPALREGRPVPAWVTLHVRFRMG